MGQLDGKVALVTGAAQGIGRAGAGVSHRDGAVVAVDGRAADDRMAAIVEATGGVAAPPTAATLPAVRAMVSDLEAAVGSVDVLVANHAYMSMGPLVGYDLADWWKVVDTNLGGTFQLVQSVLPGMRRKGAGRIIIVTSYWGCVGWPSASAYAASKAGLISLDQDAGPRAGAGGSHRQRGRSRREPTRPSSRWTPATPV